MRWSSRPTRVTPAVVRWSLQAWRSDLGLTAMASLAFTMIFVLEPLAERFETTAHMLLWIEAVLGLMMVTAVLAMTARVWAGLLGVVFVAAALVVRYESLFHPDLTLAERIMAIVPVFFVMLIVMRVSLRAGPVTYHRIAGAVLTYLLVAVLWARLYSVVTFVVPGSFAAASGGSATMGENDLMYFSIMTMTTVGYSDFLPVHPAARALASLEAMVGVLFPVVYVSRFVSALQERSRS